VLDKEKQPDILIPPEIGDSLHRFQQAFSNENAVAFLMMRFVEGRPHKKITDTIKRTCADIGITVLRADDREFHSDLYWNIMTYCHGCALGIAVYERIETESFNPNISYEVGYLHALRKPVCILKDKTLRALHADLIGKLYRPFDPHNPESTIPPVLKNWLDDNGLLTGGTVSRRQSHWSRHSVYPYLHVRDINLIDTRILQRLIQGRTRKEIANELGVTMRRVYSVFVRHRDILEAP